MKLYIHDDTTDVSNLEDGCVAFNVCDPLENLDSITQHSCKEITFINDALSFLMNSPIMIDLYFDILFNEFISFFDCDFGHDINNPPDV